MSHTASRLLRVRTRMRCVLQTSAELLACFREDLGRRVLCVSCASHKILRNLKSTLRQTWDFDVSTFERA